MKRLSLKSKLAYGAGDMASSLVFGVFSMFIMFYYTDVVGIAAGTVGTIFFAARIWDAINDPIIGHLVDRTNTKDGKARPWIKWFALPLVIASVAAFIIPSDDMFYKTLYVVITYNIMNMLYTTVNIPYGVLAPLMTEDQEERGILNIFRMVMAFCANLILGVLTIPLVTKLGGGDMSKGFPIVMVIYGVIGLILFFATYHGTEEVVKPESKSEEKIKLSVSLKSLIKNKPWFIMTIFYVIFFIIYMMKIAGAMYYATYYLGNPDLASILLPAMLGTILVGMALFVPILIKKFGKRNTVLGGLVLSVIGYLIMMAAGKNLVIGVAGHMISSLGLAPAMGTLFAMTADTIEYGEWKTGVRIEGLVYAGAAFGAKVGMGLAGVISGFILSYGGYVANQTQTPKALNAIFNNFVTAPMIFTILGIITLIPYTLDKQYPEIVKELELRKK